MYKAFIQTYGCQMNEHDSFRMEEILVSSGYEITSKLDEADLVLVNTCAVRHNPENKVFSFLGTLTKHKERNHDLIVGVAGCVAQEVGEEILRRSRVVNMVFGPDHYFHLPEMIEKVRDGERIVLTQWAREKTKVQNFIPDEWLEKGHVDGCKAYIAIMKGCNNYCSFCIVPFTRGREISREMSNIIDEAKILINKGAREIWLLGQNVNSYRDDGSGFLELLDEVSKLDGLKRIRFTSPHPKDWNNELTNLMAESSKVCNQLHLPFQAGADRILTLMNRRHKIDEFLEKVRYLKETIPGVEISTDVMVGFPTETEEEFLETLRVLEEVRFGQVFSFKYSPRPGTKAAEMDDDVPRKVKEDRLRRLIEIQTSIGAEVTANYIGTTQNVLIDGVNSRRDDFMNGRTDGYRPATVKCDLSIGDVVDVHITDVSGNWLEGELLADS